MIPEVAREPVTMQTLTWRVWAGAGLRFCVSNTSLVGSGCWPTDHRASGQAPVSAGQKRCRRDRNGLRPVLSHVVAASHVCEELSAKF